MKITVLTENHAGGYLGAEHGLSYLIDTGRNRFLLDTGHSNLFIRNAKKIGIDLEEEIDTLVLSHGHWDHGNGLRYISGKQLICHPGVFIKRFRRNSSENIGLILSEVELNREFEIHKTKDPIEIFDDVFFLGEIPRMNDFEAQTSPFVLESGDPDFLTDDSAVAIKSGDELSVITGCSHSGIVNIVEYASKVTGLNKLKMVIGGFHLKEQNRQTIKTVEYFEEKSPEILIPSHCTDLPALTLFHNKFGCPMLKTGAEIHF